MSDMEYTMKRDPFMLNSEATFNIESRTNSVLGSFIKFLSKNLAQIIDTESICEIRLKSVVQKGRMNFFSIYTDENKLKDFIKCIEILIELKHSKNKNIQEGFSEFKSHFPNMD